MLPVQMIREVPTNLLVPAWFWKVVAPAALCALMAVVLFAWHEARHPRVVVVEVPAACAAPSVGVPAHAIRSDR